MTRDATVHRHEAWAEADVESYHGVDFIYGGYDQDAMQANVASNGPVTGDRHFFCGS